MRQRKPDPAVGNKEMDAVPGRTRDSSDFDQKSGEKNSPVEGKVAEIP